MSDAPDAEVRMRERMAAVLATNPNLRADVAEMIKTELLRSWNDGVATGLIQASDICAQMIEHPGMSEDQKALLLGLSSGLQKSAEAVRDGTLRGGTNA